MDLRLGFNPELKLNPELELYPELNLNPELNSNPGKIKIPSLSFSELHLQWDAACSLVLLPSMQDLLIQERIS